MHLALAKELPYCRLCASKEEWRIFQGSLESIILVLILLFYSASFDQINKDKHILSFFDFFTFVCYEHLASCSSGGTFSDPSVHHSVARP